MFKCTIFCEDTKRMAKKAVLIYQIIIKIIFFSIEVEKGPNDQLPVSQFPFPCFVSIIILVHSINQLIKHLFSFYITIICSLFKSFQFFSILLFPYFKC